MWSQLRTASRAGVLTLVVFLCVGATLSTASVPSRPATQPSGAILPGVASMRPSMLPQSRALAITNVSISPSATELVSTFTTLNVSAAGGAPPYTYAYAGLPPGCKSANTSSLQFFPVSVGHYTIRITVNDTANASVNTTISLVTTSGYGGPPRIDAFYASPSPVKVDQKALIYVNVTPESSTPLVALGYAYFRLPPGCASFNQKPLECVPTTAGTYNVLVRVTDGFGDFNQTTMNMTVSGGPSNSGPSAIPLGPAITYVMAGVVVLLVAGAALLLLRGRRRNRGPPTAYVPPP